MTRQLLPGILAMAAIVVASNILVQFLLGDWLTWGALTYPLAFLVTDVMNRIYGAARARQVVFAGFLVGILCSLLAAQFDATTLRIAIGSGTAFLVAQMLDVGIFNRLRDGAWWRAPLVSTLIGSTIDTALFFSIAFAAAFNGLEPGNAPTWAQESLPVLGAGPLAPLWVSLAVADWAVKLSLALIALVPFRLIVARATAAQGT
ncbi:MAG: VUT family protein [Pseudomonadota bacterium]